MNLLEQWTYSENKKNRIIVGIIDELVRTMDLATS